jgi:DNA-nicking Smr family endonuclease
MTRRRLSDDERVLWKGVTRSIAPLRKRLVADPDDAEPVTAAIQPKPRPRPLPVVAPVPLKAVAPPPLAQLTRRARQRIARGSDTIDGRLDLHGMTQAEAHGALLHFLYARQARGAKLVLVITGKGAAGGGEGRGVLKRMVPMWLAMPDLRDVVVGFESAAIAHGGEGALYVRLRRTRGL